MKPKITPVFFLCSLLILSCIPGQKSGSTIDASKPLIALSILPQKYFAERIGGEFIETLVLAGPNQNPHNYEPNPRVLQDLAGAKAWVLSGIEFEIALEPRIWNLFPALQIIDGTFGIHFRSLEAHDHDDDDDDDDHHHLHDHEIDRHTWLGQEGAEIMSLHIKNTLCAIDPVNSVFYEENYKLLISDIRAEFNRLRNELESLRGTSVLVYHPAFGYFLDEFGIIQEAVESGGKEPTPRVLAEIVEKAKDWDVKVIFVQAQFPVESAGTVADATGAELVILDPLAQDWMENIRLMGEILKGAALRE